MQDRHESNAQAYNDLALIEIDAGACCLRSKAGTCSDRDETHAWED
jgi:hypothetical protein